MTKLQKSGLIMAIVSLVAWLIWLVFGLYSDFGEGVGIYEWGGLSNWDTNQINYLAFFGLVVVFAIWIGMILAGFLKKSLKRSLAMLLVSCIVWCVCLSVGYKSLNPNFCECNYDYIGFAILIFSLLFFVLWFISLFFAIKYLTNSNKGGIIGVFVAAVLFGGLLLWWGIMREYLWWCLRIIFLLFLIVSITLCIIGWIKSYKEGKKSS